MFTHGDLQILTCSSTVTGFPLPSSTGPSGPGDVLFDLASLTLGHEEHPQ